MLVLQKPHQACFLWTLVLICCLFVSSRAEQTETSQVAWFLHLSDLHLSDFHPKRTTDLLNFFEEILPAWNVPNMLITGDLTDSKERSKRSQQRPSEWKQYSEVLSVAQARLKLDKERLVDIRGNHDTFDVGSRNGKRDYFLKTAMQGTNWSSTRVLLHAYPVAEACPLYVLVGVDVAPEIGLRSPTNFLGSLHDSILMELESKLREHMREVYSKGCDPVYFAYGHYPLSMIGTHSNYLLATGQNKLVKSLLKYGVGVWFFGHLHDELGDHLSRVHRGEASTLLELELADWKLIRRCRIVAIDNKELSFLDLEFNSLDPTSHQLKPIDSTAKIDGFIVLITWPPSSYYSPLGNHKSPPNVDHIHALVLPVGSQLPSDIQVRAELSCKDSSSPARNLTMEKKEEDSLYGVRSGDLSKLMECKDSILHLQVFAESPRLETSGNSAQRLLRPDAGIEDYPHSFFPWIVLKISWYGFFQNIYFSLLLTHIFLFFLLPRLLMLLPLFQSTQQPLDSDSNGRRKGKLKSWIWKIISGGVKSAAFPVFFWSQLVYLVILWFGPWSIARGLSNHPLAFFFIPMVYYLTTNTSTFSPEMPIRSTYFYLFVVLPSTLWLLWTISRFRAKANGIHLSNKLVSLLHLTAGLFCFFTWAVHLFYSWRYYGPLSVFLSPAFSAWLIHILLILHFGLKYIEKCRRD